MPHYSIFIELQNLGVSTLINLYPRTTSTSLLQTWETGPLKITTSSPIQIKPWRVARRGRFNKTGSKSWSSWFCHWLSLLPLFKFSRKLMQWRDVCISTNQRISEFCQMCATQEFEFNRTRNSLYEMSTFLKWDLSIKCKGKNNVRERERDIWLCSSIR